MDASVPGKILKGRDIIAQRGLKTEIEADGAYGANGFLCWPKLARTTSSLLADVWQRSSRNARLAFFFLAS